MNAYLFWHGHIVCTFLGKSLLSSHKTTLKQQINCQKLWKMRQKNLSCFFLLFWFFFAIIFSFQQSFCFKFLSRETILSVCMHTHPHTHTHTHTHTPHTQAPTHTITYTIYNQLKQTINKYLKQKKTAQSGKCSKCIVLGRRKNRP